MATVTVNVVTALGTEAAGKAVLDRLTGTALAA